MPGLKKTVILENMLSAKTSRFTHEVTTVNVFERTCVFMYTLLAGVSFCDTVRCVSRSAKKLGDIEPEV